MGGGKAAGSMGKGERIAALRGACEWSLRVAALRCNVSEGALQAIEHGVAHATESQTLRIARGYGVTVEYLNGTGDAPIPIDQEPAWLMLRRKLEELSPAKRREVLTIFCQSLVVRDANK